MQGVLSPASSVSMVFLIADDSPRMRESFKRMITHSVPNHHTVIEASDGGEAIRFYNEVHPDWVLMDIKMEPVDGLDAARSILAGHPDARIVILTNYDDPAYRAAAQKMGVRAYLLKEDVTDILAVLSEYPNNDRTRTTV